MRVFSSHTETGFRRFWPGKHGTMRTLSTRAIVIAALLAAVVALVVVLLLVTGGGGGGGGGRY
jgi:hypothetical protein